jgi:hypothetical protein
MTIWIQRFLCLEELLSTIVDSVISTQEYLTPLPFSPPVIVFKHPVASMYLLYTYFSVLNEMYYLVTLLAHYMFRPYTAIIKCLHFFKFLGVGRD